MKVSIAMATYNGACYLGAQLQSFLDQTRKPDELIITDDCSTDETETIIREFANTAPFRVEFFRNENNLGYCGNFNAALMKTTGDLVFLSDQDDVWFSDKLEYMVGVLENNPEVLVAINDTALTDGELNEVGFTKLDQIRSAGLDIGGYVMGCCCVIRRELLDFCLPIPEGLRSHDNWLVEVADGLDAKLVIPKVLQYYRRHESNESQFIANRTKKVTRVSFFLYSVKKIFDPKIAEVEQINICESKLFSISVQNLQVNAPAKYKFQLGQLAEKMKNRSEWLQSRLEMRRKSFVSRIFLVLQYQIKGGYHGDGGLKAFLRDLAGVG